MLCVCRGDSACYGLLGIGKRSVPPPRRRSWETGRAALLLLLRWRARKMVICRIGVHRRDVSSKYFHLQKITTELNSKEKITFKSLKVVSSKISVCYPAFFPLLLVYITLYTCRDSFCFSGRMFVGKVSFLRDVRVRYRSCTVGCLLFHAWSDSNNAMSTG